MTSIDPVLAFLGLIGLVVIERCVELVLSVRNGRRALARGGIEVGARHYRWMVAIHALFLLSCVVEVRLLSPAFIPGLAVAMTALVAAAMALRYWAIITLGERWNTRVIVVPGKPVVVSGPYRFLRHPNYVAVAVEIVALPLVHTAWRTAIFFGLANLAVLTLRIRVEEAALSDAADYGTAFGDRPRFVPARPHSRRRQPPR